MRNNKLSIASITVVTALSALLLATGAPAGAQTEKLLHSFNVSTKMGGSGPQGNLVFDSDGNLYGTTLYGGTGTSSRCVDPTNFECGTAFQLVPNARGGWTEKVLHNFGDDGDGNNPAAGVVIDSSGNLYGTTVGGGANGCGTVFKLSPNKIGGTWTETILYNFCSQAGELDGSMPSSTLTFDAQGNLYGTTGEGGTGQCSCGVAFELMQNANGGWTEKVLHNFGNSGDGSGPNGGLVFDSVGNLYGTTGGGGSSCDFGFGCGVVFELMPASDGTWTEKLLYVFIGGSEDVVAEPDSTLIFDKAGNLFGTTLWGPGVFELSPSVDGTWTEKKIDVSCCYPSALAFRNGNIYGTYSASDEGRCCGSAFELTPSANGNWKETILHNFGTGKNGAYPSSGLIFDSKGNIYGATAQGGSYWQTNSGEPTGTVFEIAPPARPTFTTGAPMYPSRGFLEDRTRE